MDLEKFREQLDSGHSWPCIYMFKFIVPAANRNIALLESLFGNTAEIKLNQSQKGKYISLTAKEVMVGPDQVIAVYREATKIPNLIAL